MATIFFQFYHMASHAYSQKAQFSPLIEARMETLEIRRLNNNEVYESPFSTAGCLAAAHSHFGYHSKPQGLLHIH